MVLTVIYYVGQCKTSYSQSLSITQILTCTTMSRTRNVTLALFITIALQLALYCNPNNSIAQLGVKKETAPIADAGPDQTVHGADIVTLDGSKSYDPDGDQIIKYHWVGNQNAPCGIFVGPGSQLCSADGKKITVEIPNVKVPTDISFDLTVGDGKYDSNPPSVVTLHALPLATTNESNVTR
jgi:hypothetical protein